MAVIAILGSLAGICLGVVALGVIYSREDPPMRDPKAQGRSAIEEAIRLVNAHGPRLAELSALIAAIPADKRFSGRMVTGLDGAERASDVFLGDPNRAWMLIAKIEERPFEKVASELKGILSTEFPVGDGQARFGIWQCGSVFGAYRADLVLDPTPELAKRAIHLDTWRRGEWQPLCVIRIDDRWVVHLQYFT